MAKPKWAVGDEVTYTFQNPFELSVEFTGKITAVWPREIQVKLGKFSLLVKPGDPNLRRVQ